MQHDELVEAVAKAIMAERIARRAPGYAHFGAGFISPFPGDYADALAIIPLVREAAEARAREEGAKAMQEAMLADFDTWFPAKTIDEPKSSAWKALRDSLAALDPAQIAGGGK